MSVIINARIRSTTLGVEGHGILSCMIDCEGEGWGQGFGGYAFDEPTWGPGGREEHDFKGRRGVAFGMEFIRRLLDTLKVEKWEALPGQHVRLRKESDFGAIEAIGHITSERWFDPKALAAEFFPKDATALAATGGR